MDLITQLPKTKKGNDAIVVFVDKLTKMVHFAACKTSIDAPQLAQLMFDTVVRLHGMPRSIVSDRDVRFTSRFWRALWNKMGTKLSMSTAYHPQTDGQTERANRTLEEMLRAYVSYQQDDWDEQLTAMEIACNISKQASTGYSPFYLNHGQDINLPIDQINLNEPETGIDRLDSLLDKIHTSINLAKTNIKEAQEQQAKYANQNRREIEMKEGDQVMLSTESLSMKGRASKLAPKWNGPFKIKRVINPVAYELELPDSMSIHPVFHVSRLKPYRASNQDRWPGRIVE